MFKTKLQPNYFCLLTASLTLLLAGCGTLHSGSSLRDGAPNFAVDVSKIPDAVPKVEPLSHYGNPPFYTALGKRYEVLKTSQGYDERGIASWYGTKFNKHNTSNREPYDMLAMSAAHKTLPLPTYVRVTNLQNGRHVIVRINDRGPFHDNRIIDLSFVAAKKLGIYPAGTGLVQVTAIDPARPETTIKQPVPLLAETQAKLYLQLGAFAERANAEHLLAQIKAITNETVAISLAAEHVPPLYRVRIGPLPDVDTSDIVYYRLQAAGIGTAITVIEP
jgi:rare lipoprotein A